MLALELKDVNYSYFTKEKETKALQDINLSVKKGQFISIVGPSGCGKSTLLSIICGLIEPTSGEVIVNGRPVKDEMRNIGYMLQHDHLFEWRSVYGNVMLGLDIHRKKDTQNLATMKVLDELKAWLNAERKARNEKKAAKKAAALVRESEAIVQAREFSGEVYICFNNVPLLPADGLTWEVPTALAVAREAWLKWKEKEAEHEPRR